MWRSGARRRQRVDAAREAVAPPRDRRAREVERAAVRVEHDLDDVRIGELGGARRSRCAAVLIAQSARSASSAAQASISAGSISGSSPCTLTTTSSPSRPSSAQASARRSLPLGWSARVSTASTPCALAGGDDARRGRRRRRRARAATARRARATRTTIGMPPMSASGLSGSRVDASRAGIEDDRSSRRQRRLSASARRRLASPSARASSSSITGMPSRTGIGQAVGAADELLALVLRRSLVRSGPLQIGQTSSSSSRVSMRIRSRSDGGVSSAAARRRSRRGHEV